MSKQFKSGFVAIVGRPNVGKSTFMNYVLGQKIAIMSDKAQTTRNKIQGVYTNQDCQIVFLDTPGIHKPKHELGNFMVESAYSALKEVDAVLFMVNAAEKRGPGDDFIIEKLKKIKTPVFLVLNKIDLISPDELLDRVESYQETIPFAGIIPISVLQGNNVQELMTTLTNHLPEGPQYYPSDQITDHPEYFVVSELIREKILHLTKEEIPHSVAVTVDKNGNTLEGGITVEGASLMPQFIKVDKQKKLFDGAKVGDIIITSPRRWEVMMIITIAASAITMR